MTGCLVFLRRTFQIPGTENSQRQSSKIAHFFPAIVRIRETREWLYPATQPLNLDHNCHVFFFFEGEETARNIAAFHHDPNLFIIIPLRADSTSEKTEKKKGKKYHVMHPVVSMRNVSNLCIHQSTNEEKYTVWLERHLRGWAI